jgi:hypothetical protein
MEGVLCRQLHYARIARVVSSTVLEKPALVLNGAVLFLLWLVLAATAPAQVTCRVHWSCPPGSTGIAGCEGLMHGMSGYGDPFSSASQASCQAEASRSTAADGISRTCECGSAVVKSSTSPNGFQLKSTGSATGDVVNDAAQLWITQNVKNPYGAAFMQSFTQSFLTGIVKGQQQRDAIQQQLQQQRLEQARIAREAEEKRIQAMYDRLNSQLKLNGTGAALDLKLSGDATQMPLKLGGSNDQLTLKMGDNSGGYGIHGLPGLYTGGPVGGTSDGNSPGLKLGAPEAASPPPSATLPGLPGIYLNLSPEQAPAVAAQAPSIEDGQQRAVVEDSVIEAARKGSILNSLSDDPIVQNAQRELKEYDAAQAANQESLARAGQAQGQLDSEQSALDYARKQMGQPGAQSTAVQEAYRQMLSQSSSQEAMAAQAREVFDGTQITLVTRRDAATAAISMLAPPAPVSPERTLSTNATTARELPVISPNTKVQIAVPQPRAARPVREAILAPSQPQSKTLDQCMAQYAPPSVVASQQELEEKLKGTLLALQRLEKSNAELSAMDREWRQMVESTYDHLIDEAKDKAFDGLKGATKDSLKILRNELKPELEANMSEGRQLREQYKSALASGGADSELKQQMADYKQSAQALIERDGMLRDRLENIDELEEVVGSFNKGRDYATWLNSNVCRLDFQSSYDVNCQALRKNYEQGQARLAEARRKAMAVVSGQEPLLSGHSDPIANAEMAKKVLGKLLHNQAVLTALKLNPETETINLTWDLTNFGIDASYYGTMLMLYHGQNAHLSAERAQAGNAYAALSSRIQRLTAQIGCYQKFASNNALENAR